MSISRVYRLAFLVLVVGMLAACATNNRAERLAARLALYEAHAGEPVRSIRTFRWDRYEVLGDSAIALWASPRRGWLVTLRKPCIGIDNTRLIGIEQTTPSLYARFDRILFRTFSGIDERCMIETIRPIDYAAFRAAERERR